MVQRRDLMGGGLVAGFASLMATSAEATPAAADSDETANAVNRFREVYERQLEQVYDARWKGVTKVRQQQRTWLLATRKYPDFIEIGLDVWDNIYDWHVAYQQAVSVQRLRWLVRRAITPGRTSWAVIVSLTMPRSRPKRSETTVRSAWRCSMWTTTTVTARRRFFTIAPM